MASVSNGADRLSITYSLLDLYMQFPKNVSVL